HPAAVLVEIGEGFVARSLEIHGHAVDDVFERRPRQAESCDERLQALTLAGLRRGAGETAIELLAPEVNRLAAGWQALALDRTLVHGIVHRPAEIPHRPDGPALVRWPHEQ